jgi:hypothetical protein
VSAPAELERRYRRLLAWYPRAHRREHTEEMLAVLMACARPDQQHPGLAETADLIWSAVRMRLRVGRPGPGAGRPWADSLAVFSVVAPVFLLVSDLLGLAFPYRLPLTGYAAGYRVPHHVVPPWLTTFTVLPYSIALYGQVITAVLVLLGLRRLALATVAVSALYWFQSRYGLFASQALLSISICVLESAALIASPGPRRGRQLVSWRHGAVLLLAVGAVHYSAYYYTVASRRWGPQFGEPRPDPAGYLAIAVVLAAAALVLAAALRLDRCLLGLLAVMLYPYGIELASIVTGHGSLIGTPTTGRLLLLFLPPLVMAGWVVLTAFTPVSIRALRPGPQRTRPT